MVPLVSVIITVYNSSKTIKECIEAILESDYPRKEVIVIDDGSEDDSAGIVSSFRDVKLFRKKNKGSGSAKNYGAKHARGDYFYFLDSDVIVLKETVSMLVQTALSYNVDMIVGRHSTKPMNNSIVHHYKALVDYVLYIPKKYHNKVIINGQIGGGGDLYSKKSFNKLGGFNEKYSGASVEREELYIRLYKAGYNSAANPMIKTYHYFPSFRRMLKNYVNRIYETVKLLDKTPFNFTYISLEKAVIAPSFSFLLLISAASTSLHYTNLLLPAFCGIIFLVLNREFIFEGIKRKGILMISSMVAVHYFISLVIFLSIAISICVVKIRKVVIK